MRRAIILAGLAVLGTIAGKMPSPAQTQQAERLDQLPDGEVTRLGALSAWLIDPTTRYTHGVLGDAIEAGGFVVERSGKRLVYRLRADAVFEDRRVRLADLDGDGMPEAIIVKAYLDRGAAIAVYRILPDRIEPLAESEAIGARNRWLNPVAIRNFSGTSEPMIAAVVTPHLSGSLRLYRVSGLALREVARIDGYTNHIIGRQDIDLARVISLAPHRAPVIVLPTLDRRKLAAISFEGGNATVLKTWPLPSRVEALHVEGRNRARLQTASGTMSINLNE